jgi:predicted metal-dependent phosphoesterase TrpH
MHRRYDLHTHSRHSDGTLEPAELLARARDRGVEVLALTDHDVTDGLAEAASAAAGCGIAFVPGVELSVTWREQTIHVVGLRIDAGNAALQRGLARLRESRAGRAAEIDRRLEKKRISGAGAGAAACAGGAILSRTHFARFLLQQGYVRSYKQAFRQFLSRGGAAYVRGEWATLSEAVGWVRAARGQAVLAHPARYGFSAGKLRQLLTEFKECGGAALEVVGGGQPLPEHAHLAAVAREHGLLASVGSDFHGPEGFGAELGRLAPLPVSCTPVWRDWHEEITARAG